MDSGSVAVLKNFKTPGNSLLQLANITKNCVLKPAQEQATLTVSHLRISCKRENFI